MLSDQAKKLLLELVRQSVKDFLEGARDGAETAEELLRGELQGKKGVFVTIYKQGQLRGCIGSLLGILPLWQACWENARSAAVKDVRFSPVKSEELPDLDFEITIIGPARKFKDSGQIRPGKDGLILKKGFRREVFFPKAVARLMLKPDKLLDELKRKAGFEEEDFLEEEWLIFEAEVINPQSANLPDLFQ